MSHLVRKSSTDEMDLSKKLLQPLSNCPVSILVRRYYSCGSRRLVRIDSTPSVGSAGPNLPLWKQAAGERHHGGHCHTRLSRPRAVGSGKARRPLAPQPVCIEVPVTVHGGCLSTDSGKREPFSESTRPLSVSPMSGTASQNGCNPGQSIILTNEHTGKKSSATW